MFKGSFQLLAKEPLTLPAELGVPVILGTRICVHSAMVVVGSSLCLMRCLVEGLRVLADEIRQTPQVQIFVAWPSAVSMLDEWLSWRRCWLRECGVL